MFLHQDRRSLALTFALLLGSCGEPAEPLPPPNVILISLDTLRPDHLSIYGYERETAPFLAELAAESLVYTRAYTTWAWTLIAHVSMLTGFYPDQHKVMSKTATMATDGLTLAEHLKDAGYRTLGFYTSPTWLEPNFGFDRGFDRYVPHQYVGEAMENMDELMGMLSGDKPLFLFLHLFDIHNAPLHLEGPLYNPPAEYADAFMPGAYELGTADGLGSPHVKGKMWKTREQILEPEQAEAVVALYDASILHVDAQLRGMFAKLEAQGLLENSLVIITSDHGEGLSQRNERWGGHGEAYEEGLRVPLILQLPAAMRQTGTVSSPVSLVDLVPTVLDVCGVPFDARLPGTTLTETPPADRLVFAGDADMHVIWRGDQKLTRRLKGPFDTLFDLSEDPGELKRNRKADNSALLEASERERSRWFWPGAAEAGVLDDDVAEALEHLGYAGD